jgi:hypothetical protein
MRKLALAFLFMCPFFLLADGDTVPAIAVFGAFGAIAFIVLMVALGVASLFRNLTQAFRNEKRTHVWWMVLGLIVVPGFYYYLSIFFIGVFEGLLGYLGGQFVNILLLLATVPAGFYAGYFITGVKATVAEPDEKKDAKFILKLAWVVCLVAMLALMMKPVIENGAMFAANDALAEKETVEAFNSIEPRLLSGFNGVKWDEQNKWYNAHTKTGLAACAGYYQGYHQYFLRIKMFEPREGDTLAWKRTVELIYPLITEKQRQKMDSSLKHGYYGLGWRYEAPSFYVQLEMGNCELTYDREKRWMEATWMAE